MWLAGKMPTLIELMHPSESYLELQVLVESRAHISLLLVKEVNGTDGLPDSSE